MIVNVTLIPFFNLTRVWDAQLEIDSGLRLPRALTELYDKEYESGPEKKGLWLARNCVRH